MGFDHDAAMKRGAERQQLIEAAEREAYGFADRQQTVGDNEALIRLAIAVLRALLERQVKRPFDAAFEEVVSRKAEELFVQMAKHSRSEFEQDAMALKLAQKLLDAGTSKVFSDLGMWESKTFQEGAPAT